MTVKTIFADAKGIFYLNCPFCGNVSEKHAEQIINIHQPLNISCTCGSNYEVQVEFRKSFRKKTRIEGYYFREVSAGNFEKITITDLSMGGCRFLTMGRHNLRNDERVKLVFNLDNANRTKITKEATIHILPDLSVGCRFLSTGGSSLDPDIGFYLRSI